jgi:predicted MFS family arabinose efflux permease
VHSPRYVWYVIGLLCAVNVFNYVDRMALAVLAPLIKVELALSDGELGLLIGLTFAVCYAVCGIPIARWADRGSRRNIIVAALTTWSTMTALSGAAQNFWHLFMARVGVAVGEAGCMPPAQSIICDYVPVNQRSGAFAVHSFGVYGGILIGMMLAGALAETIGWRWTFVALGLPGIALAIVVALTLREPVRGASDCAPIVSTSLQRALGVLWRCQTYRLLLLFMVVNGFVQYGFNQWWPSFYTRAFGLSVADAGLYLGVATGAGAGCGLLIGGWLANRLARHDMGRPMLVGAVALVVAVPAVLASLFVTSAMLSLLLVALTGFLWGFANGPVLAAFYSVVSSGMRATAGAIAVFATSVLGFGFGPASVGMLSDLLAPSLGSNALRYALLAPVCLLPIMPLLLYRVSVVLERDLVATGALAAHDAATTRLEGASHPAH